MKHTNSVKVDLSVAACKDMAPYSLVDMYCTDVTQDG